MFRKILVPVDLTDRHGLALKFAAVLAGPNQAEVTLLHIIELIHGMSREDDSEFYERLERAAIEHLDGLLAALGEGGPSRRRVILYGDRVGELLRYAEKEGADLIVVTSHTLDPAKPTEGWGTTSHLIGIAARCPVLLVK